MGMWCAIRNVCHMSCAVYVICVWYIGGVYSFVCVVYMVYGICAHVCRVYTDNLLYMVCDVSMKLYVHGILHVCSVYGVCDI